MSRMRRKKKSRPERAAEWLGTALKLGALATAARRAPRATKKATKGAVAFKGAKAVTRRAAPVAALAGAAAVVAKKRRSSTGSAGAPWQATPTPPAATRP